MCVFVILYKFRENTIDLTCYAPFLPPPFPCITRFFLRRRWATWAACWSGWTVWLAAHTIPVTTPQRWWQRAESCMPPLSSTSLVVTLSYTAAWAACHLCGLHSTTRNGSMVRYHIMFHGSHWNFILFFDAAYYYFRYLITLIIFSISWLIKVMLSNYLFCSTNRSKLQNIQFTVI